MRISIRLAARCALVGVVATLPACRTSSETPAAVESQHHTAAYGDTVRLVAGASVRLGTSGAVVRFERVLSDSRCRPDVVCVWAGSVRVRLAISGDGGADRFVELESGTSPSSVIVGAYQIRLLPEIEPGPGSPGAYVIRLLLSPL